MRTEEQIARALAAGADTIEGEAARFAFAALDESRRQVDALRDAGQQASFAMMAAKHKMRLFHLMEACAESGFDITVSALVNVGVVIEIQEPDEDFCPAAYTGSTLMEAVKAAEKHPIKREERSP